MQAAAANICGGGSHNPQEASSVCEEVNLFSVGSALNTRAIGCVGSRVAAPVLRLVEAEYVLRLLVCKEFFKCFLHRIVRARRRNRPVSRSMGRLLRVARTDFICQLFKIAKQNVSNTTPTHLGKPFTLLNFVEFGKVFSTILYCNTKVLNNLFLQDHSC